MSTEIKMKPHLFGLTCCHDYISSDYRYYLYFAYKIRALTLVSELACFAPPVWPAAPVHRDSDSRNLPGTAPVPTAPRRGRRSRGWALGFLLTRGLGPCQKARKDTPAGGGPRRSPLSPDCSWGWTWRWAEGVFAELGRCLTGRLRSQMIRGRQTCQENNERKKLMRNIHRSRPAVVFARCLLTVQTTAPCLKSSHLFESRMVSEWHRDSSQSFSSHSGRREREIPASVTKPEERNAFLHF